MIDDWAGHAKIQWETMQGRAHAEKKLFIGIAQN